ncbi:MAG TPA: thiamine pyrophosphate-dependent enzyme, partial [Flavobacterium sp.]|nr:thiamine pyrophosphate-dependent enzyme [Flavobacterium sp.]
PLEDIVASTNIWNLATKKLVLVGTLNPNELDKNIIHHLANDPSVLVMTETTSNIHHKNFIHNIDTFITPLNEEEIEKFCPEIVLTIGGMIVSKRIKALLRRNKPIHHWHADRLRAYNTFGALTFHFQANPNDFFNQFLPYTKYTESSYSDFGLKIKSKREQKQEVHLKKIPFSDLKVFQILARQITNKVQVQIANSTPIRYTQLFKLSENIEVFCNRGTSGIDGSTSTAIGAAVASKNETVLITGDISFLYDSNALWNHYIPKNFKIILVNNSGGGIFRILPGHKENEIFHTYFETEHHVTAKHLAKMYGFVYRTASDENSLENELKKLLSSNTSPQLLEIFTPSRDNDKVLKDFFKILK